MPTIENTIALSPYCPEIRVGTLFRLPGMSTVLVVIEPLYRGRDLASCVRLDNGREVVFAHTTLVVLVTAGSFSDR